MHWFLFAGFYCFSLLSFVQSNSRVLKMQNYRIERTSQGICCSILDPRGRGGGAHKYFFDRDARPRTNFNYPKK